MLCVINSAARTHAGGRQGRLGAGVTAAHYDDVERCCKAHVR
jgi:hypothetical protein